MHASGLFFRTRTKSLDVQLHIDSARDVVLHTVIVIGVLIVVVFLHSDCYNSRTLHEIQLNGPSRIQFESPSLDHVGRLCTAFALRECLTMLSFRRESSVQTVVTGAFFV